MRHNEVDIITLGCSKNLVDSERLMRRLEVAGFRCTHDPSSPRGEIAVINTCGFIGDAKEESINTILAFGDRKRKGDLKKLYVMGCLSERYRAELEKELPEVDHYFGKFDYQDVVDAITQYALSDPKRQNAHLCSDNVADYERVITTPRHYAYLKIAEGCNRFCSYCAIPLITGRYRSRDMQEIVEEAKWLAKQGVKEVNVIAQDLSAYGTDLYQEHRLPELVERIADIKGIEWIRLHYAYPTDFPHDLLRVIRERENVCKYLDIALQHSSDHILSLMRRHITAAEQEALIQEIRTEVPDICIRTTLMVGHPQETEEDFADLVDFTRRMRFERMGCFAYSHEEGTFAGEHYEDDVPEQVKQQRVETLMDVQEKIAEETADNNIGKRLPVMIDRKEGNYYIGRTEWDSPEVDCEVLVSADKTLLTGHIYNIEITDSENFDLYGKL